MLIPLAYYQRRLQEGFNDGSKAVEFMDMALVFGIQFLIIVSAVSIAIATNRQNVGLYVVLAILFPEIYILQHVARVYVFRTKSG
jgi:hypothetical protein